MPDASSAKSNSPESEHSLHSLSEQDRTTIKSVIKGVPDVDTIVNEAMRKMPSNKLAEEYVRSHFFEVVSLFERTAYEAYLSYQKAMFDGLLDSWIVAHGGEIVRLRQKAKDDMTFVRSLLGAFSPVVQQLEFQSSQMRKSRGGRSLERIILHLLEILRIPCEVPKGKARKKLKRVDLVVPNQEVALERPDQAYFLSAKRTLRERWKQTIPERQPSWRVYLITLDTEFSADKADEAKDVGVIAYVPDSLKEKPHLKNKAWIRKLSDLPREIRPTSAG